MTQDLLQRVLHVVHAVLHLKHLHGRGARIGFLSHLIPFGLQFFLCQLVGLEKHVQWHVRWIPRRFGSALGLTFGESHLGLMLDVLHMELDEPQQTSMFGLAAVLERLCKPLEVFWLLGQVLEHLAGMSFAEVDFPFLQFFVRHLHDVVEIDFPFLPRTDSHDGLGRPTGRTAFRRSASSCWTWDDGSDVATALGVSCSSLMDCCDSLMVGNVLGTAATTSVLPCFTFTPFI